jgi:hypothetical protein
MTSDEQILWEYMEDESNELVLSMIGNIENDGMDRLSPSSAGSETVALKILSAAMLKMLAITSERLGISDLPKAYLELVPIHVELIKLYTFRALERELK